MRLKEMLMAITRSNGEVLTVDDEEIIEAQHQVGRKVSILNQLLLLPLLVL